jgi:hypothetical protein
MKEETTCFEKVISIERLMCSMGDGWGRISKTEYLLLWWLGRHGIYAAATVLLLVYVPSWLNLFIIIILAVHMYKLLRYGFYLIYDKRRNELQSNAKESKEEVFDEESAQ